MQIFDHTTSSPPSDEQFRTISKYLLRQLHDSTAIAFRVTNTQLEPSSWITLKLRADSIIPNILDLAFVGILSYSLRDDVPSIQSVLLAFSNGKRLSIGRMSILNSLFVSDITGGRWEKFEWSVDEYGEWECDDLPSEQIPGT